MGLFDRLDRLVGYTPEPRAITPAQFAHGADIERYFETQSGVEVDLRAALSLPVFSRCVNLYVDDVAQLPVDVFRRAGQARQELPRPEWMTQPAVDPNYTWADHIGDVVFSLVTDRNAFILCYPDRYRPSFFEVLDPEDIDVRTTGKVVRYVSRTTREEYDGTRVLHIRAGKSPGSTRAPSRVDQLRETIALGLAAERYGARFFRNGSLMQGMVEVPAGTVVDPKALKEQMERSHKGLEKSHALGVLTGGATFKPITVDAEKSQLLGLKEAVVEDVARSFGIPPYLVGSTSPGAVAYASTSNARVDYVVHGVVSIVSRLERAYSDLVPGADTFVRFNLNALLRGDQASRYAAYVQGLNGRFITKQEVRDWEDLGPADAASGVGSVDGGYLDTPNNNAASAQSAPPEPSQP